MKIGILTQPLYNNYGGLLQNYALQQVLTRTGHNVETLDHQSIKAGRLHMMLYMLKQRAMYLLFPKKYKKPRYEPTENEHAVIRRNTNHFIETYIHRSSVINSKDDFSRVTRASSYDAYIVGSDQCWRPCYNDYLKSMYIDFDNRTNIKRIAYAASFGTNIWEYSSEQTIECSQLASKFDLITVREDSGVDLCTQYLKVAATHVLDPTMLLKKEDYIDLIKAEKEPSHTGNLFNYILDPTQKKTAFINKAANINGLIPFQVLPKKQAENRTVIDIKCHIEDCVYPGVTAWLRAFYDAEMTIVDSFHGTVFSIIFNKPFWVIGNEARGMSRFTSLLKMFGLESRLVDEMDLDNIDINKPVNWERVNKLLLEKRIECSNLLLNNLMQ